jgi:hypothetical protein
VGLDDITGSIGQPDTTLPSAPEDVRRYTQAWGQRYDARPNDKTTVLAYSMAVAPDSSAEKAAIRFFITVTPVSHDQSALGYRRPLTSDSYNR